MYGTMRTRAPNSTQLAGVSTAILVTAAVGYALANGFVVNVAKAIETTLTFTPIVDEKVPVEKPLETTLLTDNDAPLDIPTPIPPDIKFVAKKDVIIGTTDTEKRDESRIGTATGASVVPAPVRSSPKMISDNQPSYPAAEIRKGNEGVSTLEVCLNASGRVTSASIAKTSGHAGLDSAALKWVRNARFTPGKLDGVPQSVCGHNVVYEWNLRSVRG